MSQAIRDVVIRVGIEQKPFVFQANIDPIKSKVDVGLKRALNMIRADVEQCIEAVQSCESEDSDEFEGSDES